MDRQSKEKEVQEAYQELQRLEAIQRNMLKQSGEISESLEEKLRDTKARYEAAKEELNDVRRTA
jgi:ElaB/YqjD/DUF883 family membrane-anchored ribosome-binding protein